KKVKSYIVAVAVDQYITRVGIYNVANEAAYPETALPVPLQDNPEAVKQLPLAIERYITPANRKPESKERIVLAMPGWIDVEKGVNASFLTDDDQMGLRDRLIHRLGLPVYIENDSSAIAIAELHFGAAKGLRDVMVVNMGWGIGLGMIVNGSLFRGH